MRNGTALNDIRVVDLSARTDDSADALPQVVCGLLSGAGATVVRLRTDDEARAAGEHAPRTCRAQLGHGRWSQADEAGCGRLLPVADVILTRGVDHLPGAAPESAVVAIIDEGEFVSPDLPVRSHELIAQALTGAVHETIPGRPADVGFRFGTYAAGINLATAVVAALVERLDTGSGRRLEVSMWKGVTAAMSLLWSDAGNGPPSAAPVGADIPLFECADGEYVCFSPSPREPDFLASLASALGIDGPPETLRGTRDGGDLAQYYLNADRLAPAFRRLDSARVVERLRHFDFPVEIVKPPVAAWDRPDVADRRLLTVCPGCGAEYVGFPIEGF